VRERFDEIRRGGSARPGRLIEPLEGPPRKCPRRGSPARNKRHARARTGEKRERERERERKREREREIQRYNPITDLLLL